MSAILEPKFVKSVVGCMKRRAWTQILLYGTTIHLLALLAPLGPELLAQNTAWNSYKNKDAPTLFPITQILEASEHKALVIIAAGSESGLIKGMTLHSLRAAPGSLLEGQKFRNLTLYKPNIMPSSGALGPKDAGKILWIQTGTLRAIEVQQQYTIARIERQGSEMASAFFPQFPGIMNGDLVTVPELRVARTPVIVPTITLSYFELFEDPKGTPATFELSVSGMSRLKEAVLQLASAKLSLLMVEGYTDYQGSAEENQRESYQRALTIRQILVDEFNFDPSRVIAVGYGELEPADQTLAPGYVERNRRIVLKTLPNPDPADRR